MRESMISYEILTSFLVYWASIGYGGAISSLGAGLPELASLLDITEATCGELFAFRGGGYLLGSLLSSRLGNQQVITKHGMVCLAICISGLSTGLCALTTNFMILKGIILLQGFGFALIDVFGAVCLCELWGDRVQPWIQVRSATCSFGAVIGPLLIGHLGFHNASLLVAGICFGTVAFQVAVTFHKSQSLDFLPVDSQKATNDVDPHGGSLSSDQSQPLTLPPSLYEFSRLQGSGIIYDPSTSPNLPSSITSASSPSSNSSTSSTVPFCSVPRLILIHLSTIMLIFHGVYYVANGWIPTYSLLSEITNSRSKAASLLSAYSSALMAGSTLSVVLAVYIPKKWILRLLFIMLGIGCLTLVLLQHTLSFYPLMGCVLIMGFSIGPMYGMILTLPTELHITMDSHSTSSIVFGGCIGESLLPVFVGWCIGQWGPSSFPYSMLAMLCSMAILYLSASVIAATTSSHRPAKKPWKSLKLQTYSRPSSSTHSERDDEEREEEQEELIDSDLPDSSLVIRI